MIAYIVCRLLLIPPTLLGILLLNFVIVQFAPGGPVEQMIARVQSESAPGERGYQGAAGIDPKMLFDRTKLSQAMIHRASRVVETLQSASWGYNTSTLSALLSQIVPAGTSLSAFFDQSSFSKFLVEGQD